MKRMNIQKKGGFTLIELLIVVAIIGVLASIVVVTLTGQGSKAEDAAVKANLRSVATVVANEASKVLSQPGGKFEQVGVCNIGAVQNIMSTVFKTRGSAVAGASSGKLAVANVNTFLIDEDVDAEAGKRGCASDSSGWVVWAELAELKDEKNLVFCLDSQGSTGTTAVPSDNLPAAAGDIDKAACGIAAAGIGS